MALLSRFFTTSKKSKSGSELATDGSGTLLDQRLDASTSISESRQCLLAAATACTDAGRHGESLALIASALRNDPDDPELLFARASTLFASGRFREARETFLKAHGLGATRASIYRMLGWSCHRAGDLVEAEAWMRKATSAEPGEFEPLFGLAVVLQDRGRLAEAEAAYERALELQPDDLGCRLNLVVCCLHQGDLAAAESHSRRAIAIDDGKAVAWSNLGLTLSLQDRRQEALEAFEQALRLESNPGEDCDGFVNAATFLRESGDPQRAVDLYERNLATHPSHDGYGDFAVSLLTAGRWLEGWTYYEFRWVQEGLLAQRPLFQQPAWDGQDLRGKTILLRGEQGIGDGIQFIRYAPLLKAMGATVLLQVREELEPLSPGFSGVDAILHHGVELPAFDFWVYLMSLPRVFRTDLGSVPDNVPYLRVDSSYSGRWAGRFAGEAALKIGIVWAGNPAHKRDRYRSIPLQALLTLAEVQGVKFFSLQKSVASETTETLSSPRLDYTDLGGELENLCDTAAAISELDLVICVDTAVAHLAGALGKAVWLMLPQAADYRWMLEREDSPWYPTMRIFRQSRWGDWSEVVARVKSALHDRVQGSARATSSADRSAARPSAPMLASVAASTPPSPVRAGFCLVIDVRGVVLQYVPDEPLVGESLHWYGEYLQGRLELMLQFVQPGAVVLEMGAGIGAHSIYLGRAVGASGHLLLCESRPVMRRILLQNLSFNRIVNVTVLRGTLGGPATPRAEDVDAAQVLTTPSRAEAPGAFTESLDDLQLERLDWLKINDGVPALEALDGAIDSLWRLRPMLFIAAPSAEALETLAARVAGFSYRCWRIETSLFRENNFNRREEDIFSGRRALALVAIPEEVQVNVDLKGCVELT